MLEPSKYSSAVEAFARTGQKRAGPPESGVTTSDLSSVSKLVRSQLMQVDSRISAQAAAFDPAIEGYVSYAIGGRGKRLRPLVALLTGGAIGDITDSHVDLAVIVELIHIATLVHDDI